MSKNLSDKDIRRVLRESLQITFTHHPDTLIVEEMGLCQGTARIDVAVLDGALHGYEIKSDRDDLRQLYDQAEIYNRVLDKITIVASQRHIPHAQDAVPNWWGIQRVIRRGYRVLLEEIRPPQLNPSVEPIALVQLLWRDEAITILKERSLHHGLLSKPRWVLWEKLVETLSLEELRNVVTRSLKARRDWRSARSPL